MQILTGEALIHVRALARAVAPKAAGLLRQFNRELAARDFPVAAKRALASLTPAGLAGLLAGRRPLPRFLEQVEYCGRRLAKLNVPLSEVLELLRAFDVLLDPAVEGRFRPAREQLELATGSALNNAWHEVREAETQAFFGLAKAEAEARGVEDLLRGYVRVLTRVARARTGSIVLAPDGLPPALRRPAYFAGAERASRLVRDSSLLDAVSWWSFPIECRGQVAGVIQLAFPKPWPWLPREADLLRAAAEGCGRAIERGRLLEALEQRERDVTRLAAMARQAEEEERRRIGRELHDGAAQSLLALRLQMELMERGSDPAMSRELSRMRVELERNIEDLRRVIAALGPAVLERLGLASALRQLVAGIQKVHPARFSVRIRCKAELRSCEAEVVYRIAQECLNNVLRHSGARNVNLSLVAADSKVRLRIVDDGAGFNADSALRRPMSFGLAGMRERAALLGGTLGITSAPGKGAAVVLELPRRSARTASNGKNSSSFD